MAKTQRSVRSVDQFPNFYRAAVTISAFDTLTAVEWNTGYSIKDSMAFILHKIRYRLATGVISLNGAGEYLSGGLAVRPDIVAGDILTGVSVSLIDSFKMDYITKSEVGFTMKDIDIVHDFTNEPGGGRIIAPKPLYLIVNSANVGASYTIGFEIVYTMLKISSEVYRELYESMNPNA